MSYPKGIKPWKIKAFTNAHQNFTQQLYPDQSFDVHLQDPAWDSLSQIEQYNLCTKNLQWIIQHCLENQINVRAMGSGWSLSKVAVGEDAILNTKRYRHKFTLSEDHFIPGFLEEGQKAEDYRFLQCGNTIISISDYLENKSRPAKSLRASGGSNGQTIVGAFSTNTHGAALYYGALPEMIQGIHLVCGPNEHYYIERASKPVTSTTFHEKIEATYIKDDELFNAVLVSFGSFGVIHGVLLEVEDKFLLEQTLKRVAYDDAFNLATTTGDFSGIERYFPYPLDDPDHHFYHFELAINPHDFEFNQEKKGVYMRAMHKLAYYEREPKEESDSKYIYGDDVLGLIQSVLDTIEKTAGFLNRLLIPGVVNLLFDTAYDRPEKAIGTIGETFKNTIFRGKLFSTAYGFDRKDTKKVIELCMEVNRKIPLAGILALRYVKGTQATLGFTKWEDTCVMELAGVESKVNHKFAKKLALAFEAAGIEYTVHWGKINKILSTSRLEHMYGKARLDRWKAQRSRVMSPEVQEVFNNEFMEMYNLDEYVPYKKEGDDSPVV